MNKELDQYKQVFLMGLIVGIIIAVLGIASLVNYVINNSVSKYFLSGIGLIVVGMFF
jgi:mannose/fructose/N-acetylgalactosamine-specific phosphotransferase system component IIC